ncbi:TonB-dependent receptor [Flavobacterium tegetincola]|uniref:TonB-dependent receptor n=1 Tax=Flavobacterium tegetincola TaxID=150172 RepID=UPI00042A8AB8|nr:TonB-dependent receptor [Flavobacterium tegetincola]
MKFNFLYLIFLICSLGFAQNKGKVAGLITDADVNNEAMPFVNVMIKGTTNGNATDMDGKYELSVNAGNHILVVSYVGYEPVEIPFAVQPNETTIVNTSISSGSVKLEDIIIQGRVSRAKESALLMDQKNAIEMKQSIGAQELTRKGVSDVATAVTKTTGITKQEGSGTIYVRGLGDRYNATTLNGLPVPSNNPEQKNINLDIFSTDLVEYISIDKVYGSNLYGDFAGGNVDIISKDYQGKGFIKVEMGGSGNSNAISEKDNFKLQGGFNSSGFVSRSIPNDPLNTYNFQTLSLEKKTPFAGNFGISAGDNYSIGENGKLTLFGTASFTNDYASKNEGSAASGINENATGAPGQDGLYGRKFDNYTSFSYNTKATAMANVGYKINTDHKIKFNSIFVNSSSQSTDNYSGRIVDLADDGNGLIRRSTFIQNKLFINQLLGEHRFSDRTRFNWGVSYDKVNGEMPDRTTNTFNEGANGFTINSQSAPNNNRYFQSLEETELAANATVDYKFAKTEDGLFNGKLTVGYNGRFKKRDFEATQFNVKTDISYLGTIVDPNNLDLFYNQQNFNNGFFKVSTFRGGSEVASSLNPQTYAGDQNINGVFANIEYQFGPKLTAVLGLRGENSVQNVSWNTQLDPEGDANKLEKNAFLPSLTARYAINDKQNFRFGVSKTYTLPQFKERALFVYEDITEVHVGNPFLYSSDNYNLDLKWEMFPENEELISVAAFGKYIQNPINEVTIASSTNDISYINTGNTGYAAGVELEYRKLLFKSGSTDANKLTAGLNASYMFTEQKLDSEKVKSETNYQVDFTHSKGQFTGASPLLLNADLTFVKEFNENKSSLSTTLAYTYFSDRVYSIGTSNRGDLVDQAVGTLDLIVKSKLNSKLGLDLGIKNILNPTINRVQENSAGDVNVLSYTKGLNIGLGVNYQF